MAVSLTGRIRTSKAIFPPNAIEGFWSTFKGGLKGVYKHVGIGYLDSYVNEYSFRYNRRHSEVPMFQHFLGQHKQLGWWTPYNERR